MRALQGAEKSLVRYRPLIVFENGQDSSASYYGYSRDEWFGFLASVGYDVFTLWGRLFRPADWGRNDIPWYFIAAPARSEGSEFVQKALPELLLKYLG